MLNVSVVSRGVALEVCVASNPLSLNGVHQNAATLEEYLDLGSWGSQVGPTRWLQKKKRKKNYETF